MNSTKPNRTCSLIAAVLGACAILTVLALAPKAEASGTFRFRVNYLPAHQATERAIERSNDRQREAAAEAEKDNKEATASIASHNTIWERFPSLPLELRY